jgi:hypothetical protein
MAVGDQQDFVVRIKALLPNGWFGDSTPILDAVLNGIGNALAFVYGLITYAGLQTRIATATDGFLDLISFDFFGLTLPRRPQETDSAFRLRIQAELFLERGTRNGMIKALQLLTGRTPIVFEPARPADTGAYNTNTMGYNVAGRYGSLQLRAQAFVIAYRPSGSGIPNIAGYGVSTGAYNIPSQTKYASLSEIVGNVTDADIYAAIDSVAPAGVTVWTQLSN